MRAPAQTKTAAKPGTVKTLHIFKPGRHRPMQGGAINFSEADLRVCAASYDPDVHEAPIVIGHPETDAPAYGWIAALKADKRGLWAVPRQVDPQFAEKVEQGAFKKISVALYSPDSPDNPRPGTWGVRHVGFLGAQVPAVKGLAQVAFGEHSGIVTFEENLDENGEISGTGFFAKLRALLLEHGGKEVADDLMPEERVQKLQDSIEDAPEAAPTEADIQPDAPAEEAVVELVQQVAEQAETIAKLAEEKDKLEEQLQAEAGGASAKEAAEFAEKLISEGRLLPRHRAAVVAFMEVAAGGKPRRNASGVVEFGEGDKTRPLLPAFKALLASLPPSPQFAEAAPKHRVASSARANPAAVNPLVADAARRKQA